MIKTFNVSDGFENFSQRNNLFIPNSACNATSAAMFLTYSKEKFFAPKNMQLEDYCMATMLSKWGFNKYFKWFPNIAKKNEYLPNQLHLIIAWCINQICEKETVKFFNDGDLRMMFDSYRKGYPVILSGFFSGLHHIVCGVGFETTQSDIDSCHWKDIDASKVKSIIMDDPYGDYSTRYRNKKGDNIHMPFSHFLKYAKNRQSQSAKRMHVHHSVYKKIL